MIIIPWEKQKWESSKPFSYFCYYRDLGPLRSIEKVARKFTKSSRVMKKYSSKFNWVKRCEFYDEHVEEMKRLEKEEEIKKLAREQIKDADKLIKKSGKIIDILPDDVISPHEATKMMSLGYRLKRQGLGLPDKITESKEEVEVKDRIITVRFEEPEWRKDGSDNKVQTTPVSREVSQVKEEI